MKKVCRICLESHELYYPMQASLKSSDQCSIITALKMVIPQLYLGVTNDPVICDNCLKELDICHKFRLKCYDTENKIGLFIRQQDTNETIELEDVLQFLKDQKNRIQKSLFRIENKVVVMNSSSLSSIKKNVYESKQTSTMEEIPTKKPKFVTEQPRKVITPFKVFPSSMREDFSDIFVKKATPSAEPEPDKNPPDKKNTKEIRAIHFTLCPETGRFLRVPETIKTAKISDPQQKEFPPFHNTPPPPPQKVLSKSKSFKFSDLVKVVETTKVRNPANQQLQLLKQIQSTKILAIKPDKIPVNASSASISSTKDENKTNDASKAEDVNVSSASISNTKEENKTNDASKAEDGVIIKPSAAEGNILRDLVETCNESEIKEEPIDFEALIDNSGGETTRSASETSFYEKVMNEEAGNLDSLLNQIPDIETEYDKPDYIKIANIDLQDYHYLQKNPTRSTAANLTKPSDQEKDINEFIKAPSYQFPVKENRDDANTVRLYTSYTKSGEYINDHDYLVNPYIRNKVLIKVKDGEKYSCYCICMICGLIHKLENHSLHMAKHNAFCEICDRDFYTSYMLNLHVRTHTMFCGKCETNVAYQDRQHLTHHKNFIQHKRDRLEDVHEMKTVQLNTEEYQSFRKEEEQQRCYYDPISKTFKTFNEWKKSNCGSTAETSEYKTDTPEEKKESKKTAKLEKDKQESDKLEKEVPEKSTPRTRSTKRKLVEDEMPNSENTTKSSLESSENTPSTSETDKNKNADKVKQLKQMKKTEKSKAESPKKALKTEANSAKRVLITRSVTKKSTPVSSRTRFSKKS